MPKGLLQDYSRQAQTYDRTRSASPRVVAALREAIEPVPARRLADIGGGTGNYAQAFAELGWDPLVIDRSPEMLEQASATGLETLLADAERLPLGGASFDAVLMISMLHHVDDPAAALGEARRILVGGGALAIKMFTREDVDDLWVNEYFPSSRSWMNETHPQLTEFQSLLPGARATRIERDISDASLGALASYPRLLLEAGLRGQTSYFERLQRDHELELEAGLRRISKDLEDGRLATCEAGTATLIAWRKPEAES